MKTADPFYKTARWKRLRSNAPDDIPVVWQKEYGGGMTIQSAKGMCLRRFDFTK